MIGVSLFDGRSSDIWADFDSTSTRSLLTEKSGNSMLNPVEKKEKGFKPVTTASNAVSFLMSSTPSLFESSNGGKKVISERLQSACTCLDTTLLRPFVRETLRPLFFEANATG